MSDEYHIYQGDCLVSYSNVQSLGCTPETNIILHINCDWKLKKIFKKRKIELGISVLEVTHCMSMDNCHNCNSLASSCIKRFLFYLISLLGELSEIIQVQCFCICIVIIGVLYFICVYSLTILKCFKMLCVL